MSRAEPGGRQVVRRRPEADGADDVPDLRWHRRADRAGPLLADPQYGKYGDQFPQGLGFTGLSLALLGRNHPVGIAAAALVWATIERATQRLSFIDIPQEIGIILQGSFLLAAVVAYEVVRRKAEEAETRAMARDSDADGSGAAAVRTA